MPLALRFVLAALASWRISFLLVREDGPGDVVRTLRERVGSGVLGRLLGCVKCTGVWTSIPFAFFVGGSAMELLVTWLALAGAIAIVDEWTKPPFEWQEPND